MTLTHWKLIFLGLTVAAGLTVARPASAIWIFFTPAEAIEIAFPEAEVVVPVNWRMMDRGIKKEIEREIGTTLLFRRIKCFQGSQDGNILGYACIDSVIGRSRPITYMLKIAHPDGAISHYEVMVYREQIGKETGVGGFREQFYGKTSEAPLEYGEDLRNLAGATLSAIGLRNGFAKLLAVYDHFFKNLPLLNEG